MALEGAIAQVGPRRLAEAITAPSSLLVAGAGAAAAILGGVPLLGGLAIGAGAWALKTGVRLLRVRRAPAPPIDAFAVGEPWRQYVLAAQQAKLRFDRNIATMDKGPLRTRLGGIGTRMDDGVRETYAVAKQASTLQVALQDLDVKAVRRELDEAEHEAAGDPGRATALASTIASLRSQLASAERLRANGQRTQDRLRELNAQLDELVARAVEISVSADDADVTALGSDVDHVVTEMEALRQAIDDTDRAEQPTALPDLAAMARADQAERAARAATRGVERGTSLPG